ncbi:tetratricopeptide repeat protein [Owenweeksia hongkongensis]|uniref:tetratricopeptide repeat protein n=1 Tax=Owenweeksia hongkongensis TaxID=253245 RepID=UPI003A8E4672
MVPFFVMCLWLFSLNGLGQATASFTPAYKLAHQNITQLRFGDAQAIIKREKKRDPNNRVAAYLQAAMVCAELFVNEDQTHYENNQDKIDSYISQIEDLPEASPFRNLFLGELYVAQATLNGKFKNNIKAAWQFYKAYDYLTDNYERFPDFAPTAIPLGVLYAAIGSLPDDYRSMASLLGFEGSVPEGMKMLETSFERLSADPSLTFYRPYAGFVYSYVSFLLSSNVVTPEALGLDVAKSSVLIYAQAQIELDRGNAKKALEWLDNRPEGEAYINFNYLDYLQGKILLGLDPDRCVSYFERYLQNNTSQVYVKSTYRYLSWYYLLDGKKRKSDEMIENIFLKGENNTGADRQAIIEARHGFNSTLVKARVLFDVGKYTEAEAELLRHSVGQCCSSPIDEAEYYYRMGRIKQQQGRGHQALIWYEKAMTVKGLDANYSLGNSALQTAEILRGSGDVKGAKGYYKKALKYSGFPFYEGIHQKAKAALSEM